MKLAVRQMRGWLSAMACTSECRQSGERKDGDQEIGGQLAGRTGKNTVSA